GILPRIPHADVEHDLPQLRDLVHVAEAELLLQLRPHALLVVVAQAGARRRLGRHRRSGARLGGGAGALAGLPRLLLRLRLFLFFRLFELGHRHLTRGIGWPDFTAIRSNVPSLSRRRRTRVGSPDLGSSSITLDAAIGAGN